MASRTRRATQGTARTTPRGQGGKRAGTARDAGRTTKRAPGRYTAPTPRQVRHSPRWYPWVLLTLAVLGVGVIIVNYAGGFPHSPSNWYTLGALVSLVAAALLATNYR